LQHCIGQPPLPGLSSVAVLASLTGVITADPSKDGEAKFGTRKPLHLIMLFVLWGVLVHPTFSHGHSDPIADAHHFVQDLSEHELPWSML
jgi:hypothetical protein